MKWLLLSLCLFCLFGLQACKKGVQVEHAQVEQNIEQYRKAAEQGDANAQFILGVSYSIGNGVTRDPAEAVKWFRKAAEQGNALAQYNLAVCYGNGTGVAKDDVEAYMRFNLSAVGDGALSQVIPDYLEKEMTTEQIAEAERRAREWKSQKKEKSTDLYRKAADHGDAEAQYGLGLCYEYGPGSTKDDAEAVKWYRKSAEQGYAKAQYRLGFFYLTGACVEKNAAEAYIWFNLSAAKGFANAEKYREMAAKEMTPEQIAEADRRVQEWKPKKEEAGH